MTTPDTELDAWEDYADNGRGYEPGPKAARRLIDRLVAAEHRIARLEAQTDIRGRAVVMYRERARDAEGRIGAVRGVHTGTVWPGVADKPICDACDQVWPCDTIRALEG